MPQSDFFTALKVVLAHEGSTIYSNPKTGEYSRYGISLKFLQSIFKNASRQDIEEMTTARATQLYEAYFWSPNRLSEISYQPLSTAVFDITVNMGPGRKKKDGEIKDGGITLLQRTLNQLRSFSDLPLEIDGVVGDKTILAANQAIPDIALNLYIEFVKARYEGIAHADPVAHGGDIGGWIKRADSLLV